MKHRILAVGATALCAVSLFGGVSLAANYITISAPFAKIDDIGKAANVYKFTDGDVTCYSLFSQAAYTPAPSISCVKK